jgi:hypothetical protein
MGTFTCARDPATPPLSRHSCLPTPLPCPHTHPLTAETLDEVRSLADIVRWKSAVERSAEEKEWVAIDMRMHPELYTGASGAYAPHRASIFVGSGLCCTRAQHAVHLARPVPCHPRMVVPRNRAPSDGG